jgi:hypothetical protein
MSERIELVPDGNVEPEEGPTLLFVQKLLSFLEVVNSAATHSGTTILTSCRTHLQA